MENELQIGDQGEDQESLDDQQKAGPRFPPEQGEGAKTRDQRKKMDHRNRLRTGQAMMIALFKSEDGMESLTCKEEGRPPVWSGK